MGAGMSENLLKAGFPCNLWTRNETTRQEFGDRLLSTYPQLTISPSASQATKDAQIVILCLSDDNAILDVISEVEKQHSFFLHQESLLIDCGTTSQPLTHELSKKASENGAYFIDAPITGSKLGAKHGTLTFMVGGAADQVERARPLFEAMGGHIVHVSSSVGSGQAAKYCLNMAQAVVLQGVLEGYALAAIQNVPLEKFTEILEHSAGKTGVGSFKSSYLFKGDLSAHFKLKLMYKDLRLALSQASQENCVLPTSECVAKQYAQAIDDNLGELDFLAMAKMVEKSARVKLLGTLDERQVEVDDVRMSDINKDQ